MTTWYCANCGSRNLREVQPSTDASGRTATAVCVDCTKPGLDKMGNRTAWPRGGALSTPPPPRVFRPGKRAREAKSMGLFDS